MMNFKVYLKDMVSSDDYRRMVSERNEGFLSTSLLSDGPMLGLKEVAGRIEIAAVKDLFSPDAFKESNMRIIQGHGNEMSAKRQVDLDPIVLCRTNHGYLIVTAWGGEANDELVINPKMN